VIELVPDARAILPAQEISDERRLTASGISRDHRNWKVEIRAEALDETRTGELVRDRTGRQQFCPEKKVALHPLDI